MYVHICIRDTGALFDAVYLKYLRDIYRTATKSMTNCSSPNERHVYFKLLVNKIIKSMIPTAEILQSESKHFLQNVS